MATFHIFRHGKSEYNASSKLQNQIDTPLTSEGIENDHEAASNESDRKLKEKKKQIKIEGIGNALFIIGGVVLFIIFFGGRIGSFINTINIPNTIQPAYSSIFKTTYDYSGWTPIENQYFSIQFPRKPIADTASGYIG